MNKFVLFILILSFGSLKTWAKDSSCASQLENLPSHYEAKEVFVPMDWGNEQSSPKFNVTYYVPKNYDPDKLMLFFNGGPASASGESWQLVLEKSKQGDYQIVFMDQRGTGCSAIEAKNKSSINYMNFYSNSIVKDAEAIRRTLIGNKKWSVLGQSYGSLISYRYITMFPQSLLNVKTSGMLPFESPKDFIFYRTVETNRVLEKFFNKYPGIEVVFENLKTETPKDWCFKKICGEKAYPIIMLWLGFSGYWDQTADMILNAYKYLKANNRTYFDWLASQSYNTYGGKENWFYHANSFIEVNFGGSDNWLCDELLKRPDMTPALLSVSDCAIVKELNLSDLTIQSHTGKLTADPITFNEIENALKQFPSLKVHHFSGEDDFFSPRQMEERFLNYFSGLIKHTVLKDVGHDSYLDPAAYKEIK